MRLRRKQRIRISQLLVHTAVEDAAMYATRAEIKRQTSEQIKGTWLESANIDVAGCEQYITTIVWPEIPDTEDLSFEWVD